MRLLLTSFAAGTLLVSSGCGSGEAEEAKRAATTDVAATAAGHTAPHGDYEREVSEDEIVASPGQEAPPAGTWRLTVGETVIQVVDPGGFRFSQELIINGPTFEIERYVGGDGIFCEDDKASTYRWELAEDELTLAPENEDCRDRELILGATWRKVE